MPSDALSVLAHRNCRLTGVPVASKAVTAPPLIDSLAKAVASPTTTVPKPTPRAWFTGLVKPSDANAGEALVIERFCSVAVFSVITPVLAGAGGEGAGRTVDCVMEPESASIFASSVPTVSVMLIWLGPVAPEVLKVSVWPSTVMVSLFAKGVVSTLVPAGPDRSVVLATAFPAWSFTGVPGTATLVTNNGLLRGRSAGFKPPSATSEPTGAVELATVDGLVGRLAPYVILVVACAGMKLL